MGRLLAVGGRDEDKDDSATAAIYVNSEVTNSWDPVSNMPTARLLSLVAVLPTSEIITVCGSTFFVNIDKVEIASFSYS